MIKIYAFEPEAICNPVLSASLEQFGFEHGRLIGRVPKDWRAKIYKVWDQAGRDNKALTQRLERLAKKRAVCGIALDGSAPGQWLDRVLKCDPKDIQGIIVSQKSNNISDYRIISEDDLHDDNEVWHADGSQLCARTSAAMADAASTLLRLSTKIKFIDAHFAGEARHLDFIEASLKRRLITQTQSALEIEIHFLFPCEAKVDRYSEERKANAKRVFQYILQSKKDCLSKLIRLGESITLYQWQQHKTGQRFHERYLVTDLGGLEYGGGTDVGPSSESTSVKRISETHRSTLCDWYHKTSEVFDLLNDYEIRT